MCRHIGKKKVFYEAKKGFTTSVKIFLDKIRDMIDKKRKFVCRTQNGKVHKKERALRVLKAAAARQERPFAKSLGRPKG